MAACKPWVVTSADAVWSSPDQRMLMVGIRGGLTHSDVSALCARVGALLAVSGAAVVVCDVRALTDPDCGTVDALARLQLTARRLGRQVRLRSACRKLRELLVLVGLEDVVPLESRLHLEMGRQTEQRKQVRSVKEGIHRGDLAR